MTDLTRLALPACVLALTWLSPERAVAQTGVPSAGPLVLAQSNPEDERKKRRQGSQDQGGEQQGRKESKQERQEDRKVFKQERQEDTSKFKQERKEDFSKFKQERQEDTSKFKQERKEDFSKFKQERKEDSSKFKQDQREESKTFKTLKEDNSGERKALQQFKQEREDDRKAFKKDYREDRKEFNEEQRDDRKAFQQDRKEDFKQFKKDYQKNRAEAEYKRLEDVQRFRRQRVEDGGKRTIIEEPDKRVIVREAGRAIIRHDEHDRFDRLFRGGRTVPGRDGTRVTTYRKSDGSQLVIVVDAHGRLLHRYRRLPGGRVIVLIDNRKYWRPGLVVGGLLFGGLVLGGIIDLPPPIIRIPRHKYIVEYETASYEDVYEALIAPPIEDLDRDYSLDEIRYSRYLRERVRRVDIDTINFEFGSWEVGPDQYPKLEAIARAMNRIIDRNQETVFLLEGHADLVGSEEDNLSLSDRRTETVAAILSDEFGVPPENLVTQGYGEQYPKVDTPGPERRNRRVAIRNITRLLSRSER